MDTPEKTETQESYVFVNTSAHRQRWLPLSPIEGGVRSMTKALDAAGEHLVIVSLAERRALHARIFHRAIPLLLARGGLSAVVRNLIQDPEWERKLFAETWVSTYEDDEAARGALESYFHEVVANLSDEPDEDELAILIFADFLFRRVSRQHRPWILLPKAAEPGERVLVRLEVRARPDYTTGERLTLGALGRVTFTTKVPIDASSSTRFRFEPPGGTVLVDAWMHPWHLEGDLTPEEFHIYIHAAPWGPAPLEATRPESQTGEAEFFCVITQAPSLRFVAAALHGVTALLPPFFILLGALAPADVDMGSLFAGWSVAGVLAGLRGVELYEVELATALALPLAVGVFGASWGWPAARGFATVQLLASVLIVLSWLATPIQPALGLVGACVGLGLAAFNLHDGIRALQGTRPVAKTP